MRNAMLAAALILASTLSGAEVLFPQPLHLVRRIDDPVSRSTVTLHEYAAGNQLVTVNGSRVAIADYDKQQITEIDRAAGTYSITRFDEIATSSAVSAATSASPRRSVASEASGAPAKRKWSVTPLSGRARESFELKSNDSEKIEVGVDRRVSLSRAAVEVLIGAAFPNKRSEAHDAILEAAGSNRGPIKAEGAAGERFALPADQSITWEAGGERVTMKSAVVDLTNDLPPADLLTIPPGAQRVESRTTRLLRELENLDRIPGGERK